MARNQRSKASKVTSVAAPQAVRAGSGKGADRLPAGAAAADPGEVLAAVESLYRDGLEPVGRILRKRLVERAEARGETGPSPSIASLRAACETGFSGRLFVDPGAGGAEEWSARLPGLGWSPAAFVDVCSAADPYPEDLWASLAQYLGSLAEEDGTLPGGRYACAQELVARELPCMRGLSLGQVCHIVQLAISKRKLLGYLEGAVVPYARSQSMMKEQCASKQQTCPGKSACPWPIATWDAVRACMREILAGHGGAEVECPAGPEPVPLSNVKRLFRSRFHMELSETALGYAKLSELLTDPRLWDVCTVRLCGQGYVILPSAVHVEAPLVESPVGSPAQLAADVVVVPGWTPAYAEPQQAQVFCVNEPLDFDFDTAATGDALPDGTAPPSFAHTPPCAPTLRMPMKVFGGALSPSTLAKDGRIGSCVRNTFIHTAVPPPTPLKSAGGRAGQRSRSTPKNMYSARDEWEGACNALGFLPQPVASETSSSEGGAEDGDFSGPRFRWPATPARCWPDTPECGTLAPIAPQVVRLADLVC